jgi:hypothetical protein
MGTAKNKKVNGNSRAQATGQPNTDGTASTSMAVKVNCVAALTATKSPSNHRAAQPAISTQAMAPGVGTRLRTRSRWRQISHNEISGTTKPWA